MTSSTLAGASGTARWFSWGTLLAIIAVAAVTRLLWLGHLQPWEDEVWSYIGSTELLENLLRWDTLGNREHSPLWLIEIKLARALFGPSLFVMRLPSALYGVAAAAALYLVLARWVQARVALAAALVLAVHPFVLEWHRWARLYGGWMFYAIVAMGLILAAVDMHRRQAKASPLDWRWWTLGVTLILIHASAMHGLMTVAAVAVALGFLCLIELFHDPKTAGRMALGSALSGGVYLLGWTATAIGKVLLLMRTTEGKGAANPEEVFRQLMVQSASHMAGHVDLPWAILYLALALAGLGILAWRWNWRVAWTGLCLGGLSIIAAYIIAGRHMVSTRYIFIFQVPLCMGMGALLAWLWDTGRPRWRTVGRVAVVLLVLGGVVLWAPVWRKVYLQEKFDARTVFAPIRQHALAGDVVMPIPEWYEVHCKYYQISAQLPLVFPPQEARFYRTQATPELIGPRKSFQLDFEQVFSAASPPALAPAPVPPAVWLFMVEPGQRMELARRLFAAYGLDAEALVRELRQQAGGSLTLTARISRQGVEHLTFTPSQGLE